MKNNKKIFALFGYILILFSIISLSFSTFNLFKKKDNKIENSIIVDTSKMDGPEIDNTSYVDYLPGEYFETYIKDSDLDNKNKYIFSYPANLKQYFLSDYYRVLEGDNVKVIAEIIPSKNVANYKKQIIDNYFDYPNMRTFFSKNYITMFGNNLEYFKIEAFGANIDQSDDKIYTESFTIVLQISDSSSLIITYSVNFKKMSDELLTTLINSIKLEKGTASYLYASDKDGLLSGTLQQNSFDVLPINYKIEYKISDLKYQELIDSRNTVYSTTFSDKNNSKVVVNLNLSCEDTNDIIDVEKNYITITYIENSNYYVDGYENYEVNIDDKKFNVFSFSYQKDDDEKRYYKLYIDKLSDKSAYIIEIISDSYNDDIIKDFLDYSIIID